MRERKRKKKNIYFTSKTNETTCMLKQQFMKRFDKIIMYCMDLIHMAQVCGEMGTVQHVSLTHGLALVFYGSQVFIFERFL